MTIYLTIWRDKDESLVHWKRQRFWCVNLVPSHYPKTVSISIADSFPCPVLYCSLSDFDVWSSTVYVGKKTSVFGSLVSVSQVGFLPSLSQKWSIYSCVLASFIDSRVPLPHTFTPFPGSSVIRGASPPWAGRGGALGRLRALGLSSPMHWQEI